MTQQLTIYNYWVSTASPRSALNSPPLARTKHTTRAALYTCHIYTTKLRTRTIICTTHSSRQQDAHLLRNSLRENRSGIVHFGPRTNACGLGRISIPAFSPLMHRLYIRGSAYVMHIYTLCKRVYIYAGARLWRARPARNLHAYEHNPRCTHSQRNLLSAQVYMAYERKRERESVGIAFYGRRARLNRRFIRRCLDLMLCCV